MLRFYTLLFLLTIFSNTSIAGCLTDSTITKFTYQYNNGPRTYSYQQTIFHTDSGSYDNCTYILTSGLWLLTGCNSGFYIDTAKYFNSGNLFTDDTVRQGSPSGWQLVSARHVDYNTNNHIILDCRLIYNGSFWDTLNVSVWNYNSQNILTEYYNRQNTGGTIENQIRHSYQFMNGRKISVTYEKGSGQSWIYDTLIAFNYTVNLRTSLDLSLWDTINNLWVFNQHANYDSLSQATLIYYDTIGNLSNPPDTIIHVIDTLERLLYYSRFDMNGSTSGYYFESFYTYVNDESILVHDFGADLWSYFDSLNQIVFEIDYACTGPNGFYQYDSLLRIIQVDDYSRCGMPHHTGNTFTYDSAGFTIQDTYSSNSNVSDYYTENNYQYTFANALAIYDAPWNDSALCSNSAFQPLFVIAGGCSPYTIHWTPSAGLSSDTILNPIISFQDTVTYTLNVSDQNGDTASFQYTLLPYAASLGSDSTCNGNVWETLSVSTNTQFQSYAWYRNGVFIQGAYQSTYNVTQAGQYYVVVHNYPDICDLYTDTFSITQDPRYMLQLTGFICPGSIYILPDGNIIDTAGIYPVIYNGAAGCDSVIETTIIELPVYSTSISDTIFPDDQYLMPDGQFVSDSGTYIFNLQSMDGCDSIVTINLVVETPVGISNLTGNEIIVSPVPVKNDLHIKINFFFDELFVIITDMKSNCLIRAAVNSTDFILHLNSLASGPYILSIYRNDSKIFRKLIQKL
jgi:hypothetical protein